MKAEATFSFEILPLAETASSLAKPFERRSIRAGRTELLVPPGREDRRLFVRGADAM